MVEMNQVDIDELQNIVHKLSSEGGNMKSKKDQIGIQSRNKGVSNDGKNLKLKLAGLTIDIFWDGFWCKILTLSVYFQNPQFV